MTAKQWKVGDVAAFVFGMPGPDITRLYLTRIHDGKADAWDMYFDMPLMNIRLEKLLEYDCDLDRIEINRHGKDYTMRELIVDAQTKTRGRRDD